MRAAPRTVSGLPVVLRALTLSGVVRVRTCLLCGALVLADGMDRHERMQQRDEAQRDG